MDWVKSLDQLVEVESSYWLLEGSTWGNKVEEFTSWTQLKDNIESLSLLSIRFLKDAISVVFNQIDNVGMFFFLELAHCLYFWDHILNHLAIALFFGAVHDLYCNVLASVLIKTKFNFWVSSWSEGSDQSVLSQFW